MADKRLERMRRNPKAVRPEELEAALTAVGFVASQPGTSHCTYRRADGARITVPYRKPHLLEVYVRQALRYLDDVAGEKE